MTQPPATVPDDGLSLHGGVSMAALTGSARMDVDIAPWLAAATDEQVTALLDDGIEAGYTEEHLAGHEVVDGLVRQGHPDSRELADDIRGVLFNGDGTARFTYEIDERELAVWLVRHRPHLLPDRMDDPREG